eukprot:3806366-Prymnesium_polylepis.3
MGLPPDADGELPQKEEAARAPQVRCARAQCITGAAVISTASAVAESVTDSTFNERVWLAQSAVTPCARAVHEVSGRCAHLRQTSSLMHERLVMVAS